MKLLDITTRRELKIGDKATTFRGESCTITDIAHLVYIKTDDVGQPFGVYPGVINATYAEYGEVK